METVEIQCPTCFEWFEVVVPETSGPTIEMDYDCEVCCRPMVVVAGPGGVFAKSLGDS